MEDPARHMERIRERLKDVDMGEDEVQAGPWPGSPSMPTAAGQGGQIVTLVVRAVIKGCDITRLLRHGISCLAWL